MYHINQCAYIINKRQWYFWHIRLRMKRSQSIFAHTVTILLRIPSNENICKPYKMSWCQTLHLHIFLLFWIFMCSCLQSKAPYSLSSDGFSSVCSLAYLSPINIVEHNLMGNYFRLPFWQTGSPQLVQAQPWKCKYLWILLLTAPALLSTYCAAN